VQEGEEVVSAKEYLGSGDREAEARALIKAVKLKKELKERGEYRKRWGEETVEVLSNIAKVLWESEEESEVIEVTYAEGKRTIKKIEIKDKGAV